MNIMITIRKRVGMENLKEIKLEKREWTFLFLGSAVGTGILFLPLQAGKVSLITTLISIVISLLCVYVGHRLIGRITCATEQCRSYDHAIEESLGKVAGIILSIVFILFLFTIIVIYGTSTTSNLASALEYYHVAPVGLNSHVWYVALCLVLMIIPLLFGENFLLKLIEKVVALKLLVLVLLIIMFIPLWQRVNIHHYLLFSPHGMVKDIILLLPVLIFGACFFPSIGPMSRFLQEKHPSDLAEVHFSKVNGSIVRSMVWLAIILLLFITSVLFALTPDSLDYAAKNNLTALAVISKSDPTGWSAAAATFAGYLISMLAILTAFYAVILGLIDGVLTRLNYKISKKWTIVIIFIVLFFWIVLKINVLVFIIHVISPLIILYVFFVPSIAIYVSPKLKPYRGWLPIVSLIIGVILVATTIV